MPVVLNAKPRSLEVLRTLENNPHVVLTYRAQGVSDGWALVVIMGRKKYSLEKQRGGVRVFKSLDSLDAFLDRALDVTRYEVDRNRSRKLKKE